MKKVLIKKKNVIKELPHYRRNYHLTHKKQLNGVLKILVMNPALKIKKKLTFEFFLDLRLICPGIVHFPLLVTHLALNKEFNIMVKENISPSFTVTYSYKIRKQLPQILL